MAFLFGDGYDYYNTADLFTKWTNLESVFPGTTSIAITTSAVQNGTNGIRLSIPTSLSASAYYNINKTVTAGSTKFINGFSFRYSAVQATAPIGIRAVKSGGSIQCQLVLNKDGTLSVYRGFSTAVAPSLLGTTSVALLSGNYYHVAWKVVIHASAGTVDVRINNVSALALTGKNTDAVGSGTWNGDSLGLQRNWQNSLSSFSYSNVDLDFDDEYLCDGAGGVNDDFLGVVALGIIRAQSGNGANTAFTPSSGSNHGDMVKDVLEDGDATINVGSAVNDIDTYALDNVAAGLTIKAVQAVPFVRKTDAGARVIGNVFRIGSTNYVSSVLNSPNQTYSQLLYPYDVSPATSAAFTAAEINAMEGGIKITT